MIENKRKILKKAKRMAKRRYRSEMYARYFHQYNNLEEITTEQFDRKVDGLDQPTNVFEIKPHTKKIVEPAMPVATYIHLYKTQGKSAHG